MEKHNLQNEDLEKISKYSNSSMKINSHLNGQHETVKYNQCDGDDDDEILMNFDLNNIELNHTKLNKSNDNSFKKPASIENLSFKNIKTKCLDNLPDYKRCCLHNKPSMRISNRPNFSTCSHQIFGYFKTLIGHLSQTNLKWHQDCLISATKNIDSNLDAYICNELLESLLDMTCLEARDLFRKYKASKKHHTEDGHFLLFESKRKACENKISRMSCILHLRYDLDKHKFCIFKIDNVELNR